LKFFLAKKKSAFCWRKNSFGLSCNFSSSKSNQKFVDAKLPTFCTNYYIFQAIRKFPKHNNQKLVKHSQTMSRKNAPAAQTPIEQPDVHSSFRVDSR
jgi:hypothetical protein